MKPFFNKQINPSDPISGDGSTGLLEADDFATLVKSKSMGLTYLFRFAEGLKGPFVGALLLMVLSSAMVMASARVLGSLVEILVKLYGGGDTQGASPSRATAFPMIPTILWIYGACFLGFEVTAMVLQYFGRIHLAKATIELTFQVRCQLFQKIQRLPMNYFDTQPLGRIITRVTADVEGVETFFQTTFARVLIALINIVSVLVAMLLTDLKFGLIILVCSLPALAFTLSFRNAVRYWLRTYKRKGAFVNAKLAEYLNGIGVIRLFGLEDWSKRSFTAASLEMRHAGLRIMFWNSILRPIAILLCSFPTLLILYWGGLRVLAGTLPIGALVAFVRLSERFTSPIRTLSQEASNIQEALVSGERVRRMLLEGEEDETLGSDGTLTPDLVGDVEYRKVSMHYQGFQTLILKEVSFKVKAGMSVGIVGATGSGKTTTINLLPRFYPFQSGEIFLDGTSITEISRKHLRSQLGYVYQDTVLSRGSIRNNLKELSGQSDLSDRNLTEAAAKTGLLQRVQEYPQGLDLDVGENGCRLSMGERQLVALTGVILRSPRILILDEATAHMDETVEKLVQQAVYEVMENRTTFIIAHRLSTVRRCDLILVFDQGQICEQGTFDELMGARGRFHQLVTYQQVLGVS